MRDDTDYIESLLRAGKKIPEGVWVITRSITWNMPRGGMEGSGMEKTKLVFGMGVDSK